MRSQNGRVPEAAVAVREIGDVDDDIQDIRGAGTDADGDGQREKLRHRAVRVGADWPLAATGRPFTHRLYDVKTQGMCRAISSPDASGQAGPQAVRGIRRRPVPVGAQVVPAPGHVHQVGRRLLRRRQRGRIDEAAPVQPHWR